jgi:hypothetical protein
VEYLSIICAEAAPSLERRFVVVCAWDVSVFLLEFLEIVCMTKGSKVAEWEASTPTRQELSMLVYGGASTVFSDYTKVAQICVYGG